MPLLAGSPLRRLTPEAPLLGPPSAGVTRRQGVKLSLFPPPRQVAGSGNTNPQEQQTDVREGLFLFPESGPAPATAWPAGLRAHDGPRGPTRPPSLGSMGPPSQVPESRAGPPPSGLQEGSFQKGSPGSHNALRRAQAQDLESTRGPWGLRARKRRPVQPFVGQLQGTRCPSLEAMETGRGLVWWRSSPPHPHEGPPDQTFAPSFTQSSTRSATEHLLRGLAPGPPL